MDEPWKARGRPLTNNVLGISNDKCECSSISVGGEGVEETSSNLHLYAFRNDSEASKKSSLNKEAHQIRKWKGVTIYQSERTHLSSRQKPTNLNAN